jgi:hypothetical protein
VPAAEEAGAIPVVTPVVVVEAVGTGVPHAGVAVAPVAIHAVRQRVVVEATIGRHPLHHLGDVGLRVARIAIDGEAGIVPGSARLVLPKGEGIGRHCREDEALPLPADDEGLPVPAALNFVAPAGLDEVVVARLDGEQDVEPTVGVVVQDQEIAIVTRLDLDFGPLTLAELAVAVEPQPNGRRVGAVQSLS